MLGILLLVQCQQPEKKQAEKLRVPISTYCRTKLTQDINPELSPNVTFNKDAIEKKL